MSRTKGLEWRRRRCDCQQHGLDTKGVFPEEISPFFKMPHFVLVPQMQHLSNDISAMADVC